RPVKEYRAAAGAAARLVRPPVRWHLAGERDQPAADTDAIRSGRPPAGCKPCCKHRGRLFSGRKRMVVRSRLTFRQTDLLKTYSAPTYWGCGRSAAPASPGRKTSRSPPG